MARTNKCGYLLCQCITEQQSSYCSDYCEQAATHGFEREYCQCEHELACAPLPLDHNKSVARQSSSDPPKQRYRVAGA